MVLQSVPFAGFAINTLSSNSITMAGCSPLSLTLLPTVFPTPPFSPLLLESSPQLETSPCYSDALHTAVDPATYKMKVSFIIDLDTSKNVKDTVMFLPPASGYG